MPYKKKSSGYCVYKLTSPNGKVYIGTTNRDPRERWNSGHGYRQNTLLFNDIVNFGWNKFSHEIICDFLSKEEAFNLEKQFIKEYDSTNPECGYNKHEGGKVGAIKGHAVSEKARAALCAGRNGEFIGGDSPRARKVNQYDFNGNFIKTWNATTDIQREFNICYTNIVKCCTGVYASSAGYIWLYPEDESKLLERIARVNKPKKLTDKHKENISKGLIRYRQAKAG